MTKKKTDEEKAADAQSGAKMKGKAIVQETNAKAKAKVNPAADKAVDEVEAEENVIVPLARGAVVLAQHRFQSHAVTVPGATPKDVPLSSDFWTNNAAKLNPGDEIRILTDDYAWMQTLLVVYKGGSAVGVVRLSITDIDEPLQDVPQERFTVVPGLRGGYVVKDMVTGKLVGGASPTRSKAERQREDHIAALNL